MSTHPAPLVTHEVAARFHSLRRHYLTVSVVSALAGGMAGLLMIWLLLATCDYLWEWPLLWRKIAIVIGGTLVAVGVTRQVVVAIRGTRQRSFATRLEQSFQEFGQRIRTVLDTVDGRVGGPQEMLTALGHQTLGRWETLAPSRLVPSRGLAACVTVLLVVVLIAVGCFTWSTDWQIAMQRALGNDLPYTTLSVQPGDAKILEGAPVRVSLQLAGRTNRDVILRQREVPRSDDKTVSSEATQDKSSVASDDRESTWIEHELYAIPSSDGPATNSRQATFAQELGRAVRPMQYQFVTSAGATRVFQIDVQPLIDVTRLEAIVQPPSYTGLAKRSFTTTELTVLEHSQVQVTIQTNHALSQATLATGVKLSQLQSHPVQAGSDRRRWTFELPSTESLHWRFSGSGEDGTPMTPVKGRLRVREDAAPTISWLAPQDELRVHSLAEVPMRALVSDDYGVTEAGIVFQIGGDEDYVLTDWLAPTNEQAPANEQASTSDTTDPSLAQPTTRVRLEEILPLESFALSERDYISYYAYATDNRASGARRVETDFRYIDIRPLRQYFSEIEIDPNAGSGSRRVLVQLDEIIRRQRFLINRTRRLTHSSNGNLQSQLGTLDRMVESQSELAGLTRFLAEFFVSQGNDDIEALNQAEAAMLQAADSLAAGSFDLSLVQEEDALRALAEARRTLEVALLKNATPAQQRQLRRFANQLRQKLRRSKNETEQQLADTLQKLASEQAQLGARARQLQRNLQLSQAQGNASAANVTGNAPATTEVEKAAEEDAETKAETEAETDAETEAEKEAARIQEQQEELYADEVDLLDRYQAIQDRLADRSAESPLMARRMSRVASVLDSLAGEALQGHWDAVADGSNGAADQLRELGIQLDAVSATEAIARVSAIRDMTTSLANFEYDLGELLSSTRSASSAGTTNPDASATSESQQTSDVADEAGDAKLAMQRIAERLRQRSETVEDILKTPVAVGDVETSEVNDHLAKFVQENEFLDQLAQSRAAVEPISDGGAIESESAVSEALDRARDYADASQQLDELYRSLVQPRLAQLRRLEQRASQLASQLGNNGNSNRNGNGTGNGNGTAGKGKPQDKQTDVTAGIAKLREELERQGLSELAELLEPASDREMSDEEMTAGETTDGTMSGSSERSSRYASLDNDSSAGRALLLVSELRELIQSMILLEISADRDTPVPTRYRTAVDGYFRTLAGDADPVREVQP